MSQRSAVSITKSSTLLYSLFTAVGLAVIHLGYGQLISFFEWQKPATAIGKHILIGSIAAAILLLSSEAMSGYSSGYRNFRREIERTLGPCSFFEALYLAVISGIGEEILFRGAIQPWLGLYATSLIFGLLHLGPGLKVSAWTIWAIGSGLLLGWLFERTGSLVAPISGHILVNTISIQRLRFTYQSRNLGRGTDDS